MQIALVGIGKIALDQHVPAIAASSDWELAATVSRKGTVEGVPAFTDFPKPSNSHFSCSAPIIWRAGSR